MKNFITAFFCFMALNSFSQNEKYYQITKVYREDKAGFRGFTLAKMQQYLDNYYHFIKKDDMLYFDLPQKLVIAEKDLKSLNNEKYENTILHEIYKKEVVGDKYLMRFTDNATSDASKKTVIEFTEVSKEKYYQNIEEEIAYQKKAANEITVFKDSLQKNPLKLKKATVLKQKKQVITDYMVEEITFSIPLDYNLRQSGNIKNSVFGDIKTGTLQENSIVYEIENPDVKFGLDGLAIYMLTDKTKKFNIAEFLKSKENYAVIMQDKNSFVAYDITYDFDKDKPVIGSYEIVKYFNFKDVHIFIASSSSVHDHYINGIKQPSEDILKIINANYELMKNINVIF